MNTMDSEFNEFLSSNTQDFIEVAEPQRHVVQRHHS